MKIRLRYPLVLWSCFIPLVVVSQFETLMGFTLLGLALTALWAVVYRNRFLHPLGQVGYPYYYWLRTTPYTPDQPLPNGSVMPGWEDAVFVLGLLFVSSMAVDFNLVLSVMCWSALLNLIVLLFSFITVRDLLNVGPRWMAYVICFCMLVAFHIGSILLQLKSHWTLGLIAQIPAFVASVIGLHLTMQRYPWNDSPPPVGALVSNLTFKQMQNNYSDVTAMGQPFTSLRPDGRWPRVPQMDAVAASLLMAYAAYVFKTGEWSSFFLLAELFGLVVWGRLMLYGTGKTNFVSLNALRRDMKSGQLSQNLLWSVIVIMCAGFLALVILNLIVRWFPLQAHDVLGFLTPIFGGLLCYLAIKLPPSRETWETMGRWIAKNEPDTDTKNRLMRSDAGAGLSR